MKILISSKIANAYVYCVKCGKVVFQRNSKGDIVINQPCNCKKDK